ncbi:MAG: SCP2 sterol-binding domain-containing protein [Pseudomonadota bacterium]
MSAETIRTLIFGMPTRLNTAAAEGLQATIEFVLSGPDGGTFAVTVADGVAIAAEQSAPAPDLSLRMSPTTYIEIAMGRLSGPQAFFRRKVKFTGDLALAMKLHTLFPSLKGQGQA